MPHSPRLFLLLAAAMLAASASPALPAQQVAAAADLPALPQRLEMRTETQPVTSPATHSATSPENKTTAPPVQGTASSDTASTGTTAAAADPPGSEAAADALSAHGRYLAAIRLYAQLQPGSASIQNRMGVASERMGLFEQAQRCFETAIRLDPQLAEAWNNLGTVFHSRGDMRAAEKMYRRAIKLRPRSADAYQNLGALYYSKRNFKKGDSMYREAVRIDPGVMERSAERGIQAPGSVKNNAEMHYHLACTLAQSGRTRLALDYLRRSIVEGFHDRNRMLHETSFADLRTSETFLKMVDDLKNN